MKKTIFLLMTIILLLVVVSCASVKSDTQSVSINSNPQGATLKIDGITRGKTPLVLDLTKTSHMLEFSKSGYETGYYTLSTKKDKGALVADVLLFSPLVAVFDADKANKLATTDIFVELVPLEEK